MDVTSTTATSGASADATGSADGTKQLGKDAFLKLLLAQLKNQDPLAPMDNQAFVTQLAQFSSVEQLQGISGRLDTLLLAQASANQMAVASLVGKEVLYRSDLVQLSGGTASPMQATLGQDAKAVTGVVTDASGRAVRTLVLGGRTAGTLDVVWDGRGDDGQPLPDGEYHVTVTANLEDGTRLPVQTRARGIVQGASFEGDAPRLVIAGSPVKLSDVVEIDQANKPQGA